MHGTAFNLTVGGHLLVIIVLSMVPRPGKPTAGIELTAQWSSQNAGQELAATMHLASPAAGGQDSNKPNAGFGLSPRDVVLATIQAIRDGQGLEAISFFTPPAQKHLKADKLCDPSGLTGVKIGDESIEQDTARVAWSQPGMENCFILLRRMPTGWRIRGVLVGAWGEYSLETNDFVQDEG